MIHTREIAKEYRLAHWAQVFQERVKSGMNIKDFCEHIGICGNTYFYWQRRVRAAACEMLAETPDEPKPGFAQVKLIEAPNQPAIPEEAPPCQICVEAAGVKITANGAYPTDKLASLFKELVRPC